MEYTPQRRSINDNTCVCCRCRRGRKNTVGKKIAEQLRYVYLDKDTIAQPFVEALNPIKNDRESTLYLNTIRPLEYQVLLDVAEENLRLGQSVVLSAPFGARSS